MHCEEIWVAACLIREIRLHVGKKSGLFKVFVTIIRINIAPLLVAPRRGLQPVRGVCHRLVKTVNMFWHINTLEGVRAIWQQVDIPGITAGSAIVSGVAILLVSEEQRVDVATKHGYAVLVTVPGNGDVINARACGEANKLVPLVPREDPSVPTHGQQYNHHSETSSAVCISGAAFAGSHSVRAAQHCCRNCTLQLTQNKR
mmetsp:Transcript_25700/g.66156  ORF Transcript_25700/g.66156 Transcript_25700/m.66156 type:complete len:201 (-) Transcript_25700:169-771(-)